MSVIKLRTALEEIPERSTSVVTTHFEDILTAAIPRLLVVGS